MAWKSGEFQKLCKSKGITCPIIYQNTLQWKISLSDYHAKRAKNVWEDFFTKKGDESIKMDSEEWKNVEFTSEAHTIAASHALHSMADVMAQIVNHVIFEGKIPENKVSLKTIKNGYKGTKLPNNIEQAIDKLLNDLGCKYIDAFVNKIKHQHLIYRKYVLNGKHPNFSKALRFKSFQHKEKSYPETWAIDIIESYRKSIIDKICAIGTALNDYLR